MCWLSNGKSVVLRSRWEKQTFSFTSAPRDRTGDIRFGNFGWEKFPGFVVITERGTYVYVYRDHDDGRRVEPVNSLARENRRRNIKQESRILSLSAAETIKSRTTFVTQLRTRPPPTSPQQPSSPKRLIRNTADAA